jgi:hypothetical protein
MQTGNRRTENEPGKGEDRYGRGKDRRQKKGRNQGSPGETARSAKKVQNMRSTPAEQREREYLLYVFDQEVKNPVSC